MDQLMNQQYENYTDEDRAVWKILFERQYDGLSAMASGAFMEGLEKIGFTAHNIPHFEQTNAILQKLTGWSLVVVPGIVDDRVFFELLAKRKFPATTWLRKMAELDYLEEPDMFHDVFAHVPLLTNPDFVGFLEALGNVGVGNANDAQAIDLLSRIYWFTVEFGLIREAGRLRIYGAGILSSAGETTYALGDKPDRHDYEVGQILDTSYRKDVFQSQYFVVDSYRQLYDSVPAILAGLTVRHPTLSV